MQTPKATVTPDHKLAVERIQAASSWATRWRCPAHSTKGQALRFRLKTETRLFPSVYNSDSFPGALGKKKQVKYSFSNLGTREETPQSAFTITAPGTQLSGSLGTGSKERRSATVSGEYCPERTKEIRGSVLDLQREQAYRNSFYQFTCNYSHPSNYLLVMPADKQPYYFIPQKKSLRSCNKLQNLLF